MERTPRVRLSSWRRAFIACVVLALFVAESRAQEPIARVTFVRGEVTARAADDSTRPLARGSALHVNERVITGRGAAVQVAFTDETRLALGARGEFRIDQYGRAEAEESFVLAVAKGVFRMVTGVISRTRPQAVRVEMPVGTIGIRGTHFGGDVGDASATVVLLDPESPQRTAIEVSNAHGAVVIDEPGFGTDIPDAGSAPTPPRRMRLRAIDNLIRSLTSIPRVPPSIPRR